MHSRLHLLEQVVRSKLLITFACKVCLHRYRASETKSLQSAYCLLLCGRKLYRTGWCSWRCSRCRCCRQRAWRARCTTSTTLLSSLHGLNHRGHSILLSRLPRLPRRSAWKCHRLLQHLHENLLVLRDELHNIWHVPKHQHQNLVQSNGVLLHDRLKLEPAGMSPQLCQWPATRCSASCPHPWHHWCRLATYA